MPSAATAAEGEILAGRQVAGAEAGVQDVGDELLGGDLAEFVGERQLVEQRHTHGGERVSSLGGEGQAERRVVGAEILARVRFEGQHRQGHVGAGAVRDPQQVRVAQMHAVEIAERHRGAAGVGGQVPPVTKDAHQSREGTWT
jgi:hypothetical protein